LPGPPLPSIEEFQKFLEEVKPEDFSTES